MGGGKKKKRASSSSPAPQQLQSPSAVAPSTPPPPAAEGDSLREAEAALEQPLEARASADVELAEGADAIAQYGTVPPAEPEAAEDAAPAAEPATAATEAALAEVSLSPLRAQRLSFDQQSLPPDSDAARLRELREEYEGFRASTQALCEELRAREDEVSLLRAELRGDTATTHARGDDAAWRLQRAEAAVERARQEAGTLRTMLERERATAAAVRAQLSGGDAAAAVAQAEEGALRAELARLRVVAGELERENELSRSTASALQDAQLSLAASTTLAERLLADNAVLTVSSSTLRALVCIVSPVR